jgi:hypothetical protein
MMLKNKENELYYQETSYRRGYHHGYSTAIDNIKMFGVKIPKSIYNFFNKALFKWRNTSSSELEMPPQIKK